MQSKFIWCSIWRRQFSPKKNSQHKPSFHLNLDLVKYYWTSIERKKINRDLPNLKGYWNVGTEDIYFIYHINNLNYHTFLIWCRFWHYNCAISMDSIVWLQFLRATTTWPSYRHPQQTSQNTWYLICDTVALYMPPSHGYHVERNKTKY